MGITKVVSYQKIIFIHYEKNLVFDMHWHFKLFVSLFFFLHFHHHNMLQKNSIFPFSKISFFSQTTCKLILIFYFSLFSAQAINSHRQRLILLKTNFQHYLQNKTDEKISKHEPKWLSILTKRCKKQNCN